MSSHPKKWQVQIPKEDFEKLRSDTCFIALIPLARVINSLKFCFQTMLEHSDNETPSGTRQHLNSFLFGCGVLYEGLKIANSLGKHFGEREAFQDGFGKLLKSSETKKLNDTVLNSMRNKIVFHFDEDVAPSVLKNLDLEQYVFATADGSKSGEVYYNLADVIAINYIIGEPGSHEEETHVLKGILQSVSIVITDYVNSADKLIADVLKDSNWRGREREQASP